MDETAKGKLLFQIRMNINVTELKAIVRSNNSRGWWSANKFRKSQSKFVVLQNLLDLRTFRICGSLRI
jgi:hypothetical protein